MTVEGMEIFFLDKSRRLAMLLSLISAPISISISLSFSFVRLQSEEGIVLWFLILISFQLLYFRGILSTEIFLASSVSSILMVSEMWIQTDGNLQTKDFSEVKNIS